MKRSLGLSLVLACAGCAGTTDRLPFDSSGFHRPHAAYRIDYVDAARHRMLGDDWRIDNYPLAQRDEAPESTMMRPLTDLVLQHRRTHAMIWTDAEELGASLEQTELRVLADNWVASIARNGYLGARVISPTEIAVSERRYAAEILDRRAIQVGGTPAHAVLIDVANLNQTEITPEARAARALIVFVRMPHPAHVREGFGVGDEPLVMISGYANAPAEFGDELPDFIGFLESIRFQEDDD